MTREASGVRLKNSVIIIDEAHNLTDAITNIHSVEVTGAQLLKAHSQLLQYQERYKLRLTAKNMLNISQLLVVLVRLIKQLGGEAGVLGTEVNTKPSSKIAMLNDFLMDSKLDNVNLFKIIGFCETSEIAKKLIGFVGKYQAANDKPQENKEEKRSVSKFLEKMCEANKKVAVLDKMDVKVEEKKDFIVPSSPLNHLISFFRGITNENKDGRIVTNIKENVNESTLKYMLLNPSTHFKEIISDAKAIVVAGGTMQPTSEFVDQLFIPAGAKRTNIVHFSYGHVIPDENLVAMVMAKGPSGMELNFSYENRQTQPHLIAELGRLVCNISNVIPGGIVVFFPSYNYANSVYEQWTKTPILDRISTKKEIFKEPKTTSECQRILSEYSKTIQVKNKIKNIFFK
uniref:Helicase ATP-binding domain-containing protein n=1 Tax=Strigamia maritima TaxID=126957 RepID=T1J1W5_STRMM